MSGVVPQKTLNSNDNLDLCVSTGLYFMVASSLPSNAPSSGSGVLVVFKYNDYEIIQLSVQINAPIKVRIYHGNWFMWK